MRPTRLSQKRPSSFQQQNKEFEEQRKNRPWERDTNTIDMSFMGSTVATTVTNCADDADQWINRHAWPAVWAVGSHLGISVIWTVEGSSFEYNKSCVLSLATGSHALILQLDRMDHVPPFGLQAILRDESVHFGAWRADEVRDRLKDDHELQVANVVDLRHLAATKLNDENLRKAAEDKLAFRVLGYRPTSKNASAEVSKWEKLLDREQLKYAAYEAWLRWMVFHKLLWGSV